MKSPDSSRKSNIPMHTYPPSLENVSQSIDIETSPSRNRLNTLTGFSAVNPSPKVNGLGSDPDRNYLNAPVMTPSSKPGAVFNKLA